MFSLKRLTFESLIDILTVKKKIFKFLTIVPAIVEDKQEESLNRRRKKIRLQKSVQLEWLNVFKIWNFGRVLHSSKVITD